MRHGPSQQLRRAFRDGIFLCARNFSFRFHGDVTSSTAESTVPPARDARQQRDDLFLFLSILRATEHTPLRTHAMQHQRRSLSLSRSLRGLTKLPVDNDDVMMTRWAFDETLQEVTKGYRNDAIAPSRHLATCQHVRNDDDRQRVT